MTIKQQGEWRKGMILPEESIMRTKSGVILINSMRPEDFGTHISKSSDEFIESKEDKKKQIGRD